MKAPLETKAAASMRLPRWLDPNTNPGLYTALASLGVALWQAFQVEAAKGPLTWPQVGRVAFPLVVAALVSWQRAKTTPVADPRDGNGNPLKPQGALPVIPPTKIDFPQQVAKAVVAALGDAPQSAAYLKFLKDVAVTPVSHTGPSGSTLTLSRAELEAAAQALENAAAAKPADPTKPPSKETP